MKIKKVHDYNIIKEQKDQISYQEMMEIYDKYGFDIHSIPSSIQSKLNRLIKDYIKIKNKK